MRVQFDNQGPEKNAKSIYRVANMSTEYLEIRIGIFMTKKRER